MEFTSVFPLWDKLDAAQQRTVLDNLIERSFPKGTVIHDGGANCTGLLLVKSGQLRAFILSEDGREISIYRLFARDMCLFSASCMLRSARFSISIEAEKDSELWIIPAEVYQRLMEQSAPLANYTNELMASRFSEVMWLMEQILWQSMDKRLAAFLLDESLLEEGGKLSITHEQIARHLGTAREVVTRMLKYFRSEGMVALGRGSIEILDGEMLSRLANS